MGAAPGSARPSTVPARLIPDVLRGSGQPLDAPVKEEMEARFGADFSDVRVHTDGAARASAAGVGARAYTSGSHVVIGDRGADKHTLAHELTHVIQQRQGPVAGTDHGNGLKLSDPSDHDEKAAEVNAARAMRAPLSQHRLTAAGSSTHGGTDERMRGVGRTLPGPVIQRTPDDAAEALRAAGYVSLNMKQFGAWLKDKSGKGHEARKNADIYNVGAGDLVEVNRLLGELKKQAAAAEKIEAARAKLAIAQYEAPRVHIDHKGVSVDLDTDQLKHQPPGFPIGTRRAAGGAIWPTWQGPNKELLGPDAEWHRKNTLPIIGEWAADLDMQDGEVVPTKQGVALDDGNYYEGFCVQVDGEKHVFFHCYPPRKRR